jgi:hypothetical protein
MKPYDAKLPRMALGIAAVAMTAITLGLAVLVPAEIDGADQNLGALASAKGASPDRAEVAANLAPAITAGAGSYISTPELISAPMLRDFSKREDQS